MSYKDIENGKTASKLFPRAAISIAATGQDFDFTFSAWGDIITKYILEIPTYTNGSVTTQLLIIDQYNVTVFTGDPKVCGANAVVGIDVEVEGSYTARLHLSGVSGGTHVCHLTFMRR